MYIDGRKCLKPEQMTTFVDECSKSNEDICMLYGSTAVYVKPSELRKLFEDEKIESNMTEDTEISLIQIDSSDSTNDVCLQIVGLDYLWWIAPVRGKKYSRLDKLFGSKKVIEKKTNELMTCYVGSLNDDGSVSNVEVYTGTKSECTNFINKTSSILYIRSYCKKQSVVSFDAVNFKTIDQMKKDGDCT